MNSQNKVNAIANSIKTSFNFGCECGSDWGTIEDIEICLAELKRKLENYKKTTKVNVKIELNWSFSPHKDGDREDHIFYYGVSPCPICGRKYRKSNA